MRKNVLLIYNPSAGKNGAGKLLPKAIQSLRNWGCRVTVFPVSKNYGAEDIIKDEASKADIVVCCGGDGTMNHTINGLMALEKRPYLGYIPAGSTNDFAVSAGIEKDVGKNCRNIACSRPFFYDIGKFNNLYFNYIAAFGAFTRVSYSTPQSEKNALGHMAYMIEGVRNLPIGQYIELEYTHGGKEYSGEYIYGAVSNTKSVGGMNFRVLEDSDMDDGLFEVILIKRPKNILDVQNIISALILENYKSPYFEYFKTNEIEFRFKQATSWTLDGEFGGETDRVNIKVENKAIGLLK